MTTCANRSGQRRRRGRQPYHLRLLGLVGLLGMLMPGLGPGQAGAQDAPVAGQIEVIAQGVAEVPAGDLVWRTVRARADQASVAPFSERPLSFVIAAEDPLLLADETLTHLSLLFPGEAAFVPPGVRQQRSSLTETPVTHLAVELVAADAALSSDGSTVLQPGQPFPSPGGFRDFDLVQGFLTSDDAYLVPDTGQKNIILVTAGAVAVSRAGSEPTTLIAGESATFSGELEVAGTTDDPSSFAVAIIGDEVIPPAARAQAPAAPTATAAGGDTPTPEAAVVTPAGPAEGTGSISVEAWLCPPGMTPQTLFPDQCELTTSLFEATLAGPALPEPLLLIDATEENGTYRWSNLPFGEYRLAETFLPENYETYILAGAPATGDADTVYTVTLSAETPDLSIQFFNFVSQ